MFTSPLSIAWAKVDPLRQPSAYVLVPMIVRPRPYRDYLIRAFNEDKPYDRFVREQITGDISKNNLKKELFKGFP